MAADNLYREMDIEQGAYGQNIAAGVEANNVSAVITELFYNGEVGYYDNLYAPDPTDPDAKDQLPRVGSLLPDGLGEHHRGRLRHC
jgi:hypothetical protein